MYCIAGFGSGTDWLANLKAHPQVEVSIAGTAFTGTAEVVVRIRPTEMIGGSCDPGHKGWILPNIAGLTFSLWLLWLLFRRNRCNRADHRK